ncbi:hypothetical protein ACWGLF_39765 [Streptomyces puniciscabiei]
MTFTTSHYVWPHVRVTCDAPWPLRITYPALSLGPAPTSGEPGGTPLRTSRSTKELATLLGLSRSVISRRLRQTTQAGLNTTWRDGC